jgi:hypothetical protein
MRAYCNRDARQTKTPDAKRALVSEPDTAAEALRQQLLRSSDVIKSANEQVCVCLCVYVCIYVLSASAVLLLSLISLDI